jgi:hypothetical protein
VDLFGSVAYAAFIGIMMVLMLVYVITYKKQHVKISRGDFFAGLAIYIIVCIGSILVGRNSSSYSLFEYVFYAFFIFAVLAVLQYTDIEFIFNVYEIVGIILGAEAIWEFATGNILYRTAVDFQVMRRAYGLIGSPLTLGMVLACVGIISFYRARNESKIHLLPGVIAVIGMFCTQSRGPIVGLFVGLICEAYFDERRKSREKGTAFAKTLIEVLLVVAVLALAFRIASNYFPLMQDLYKRIQTILEWGEAGTSNYTRQQRWAYALELHREYPIFGYGISSTGPHASTGIITESGVLKRLVEIGIVGFVIYYGTYITETVRSIRICDKKQDFYAPIAIGLISAIFVENIIMQIVESAAVYLIFSISLGYLLKISRVGVLCKELLTRILKLLRWLIGKSERGLHYYYGNSKIIGGERWCC